LYIREKNHRPTSIHLRVIRHSADTVIAFVFVYRLYGKGVFIACGVISISLVKHTPITYHNLMILQVSNTLYVDIVRKCCLLVGNDSDIGC